MAIDRLVSSFVAVTRRLFDSVPSLLCLFVAALLFSVDYNTFVADNRVKLVSKYLPNGYFEHLTSEVFTHLKKFLFLAPSAIQSKQPLTVSALLLLLAHFTTGTLYYYAVFSLVVFIFFASFDSLLKSIAFGAFIWLVNSSHLTVAFN